MIVLMAALRLRGVAGAAAVVAALWFGSAPALAAEWNSSSGEGHNVVQVVNRVDNHLKVRGRVDFNVIEGPTVTPLNAAFAFSSCNGCQTLAVALQINLISRTATNIRPQNIATAVNYQCVNCVTIADAVQYTIAVADPNNLEPRVDELFETMQGELRAARSASTLAAAIDAINAVIAQFEDLAQSLMHAKVGTEEPTTAGAAPPPPDLSP